MHIGLVGLGKMGANMRLRLRERGVEVTGFDHNPEVSDTADLPALVAALPGGRRVVWVMVPAGAPTQDVVSELGRLLVEGDVVVEGGNSHYTDDIERAAQLAELGVHYVDIGVSGGVWGRTEGYGLMAGGAPEDIELLLPVLDALRPDGRREQGFVHGGVVGPDGQGKTNLVEAIAYAATLASYRVASDAALVRAGAPRAVVRVRAVRGERESLVEMEINPGRANRAQVNRSPVRRTRDVLGILRTLVFAPEDLALVKGDPDGRRRFLDELTIQVSPRMAGVLADYDRVLRQRGALLKTAGPGMRRHVRVPDRRDRRDGDGGGEGDRDAGADVRTLDVWDAKLAQVGAQVLAARVRLVEQLRPHVELAYAQVSDGGVATLGYRSSLRNQAAAGDDASWAATPPAADVGAAHE